MKRNLLLYLSRYEYPQKNVIAATLAWVTQENDFLFDLYYDSYHLGSHYGGGDPENYEIGDLTGGTVCGGHHFEEFYFILNQFNTKIASSGSTLFSSAVKNLEVPIITESENLADFYQTLFDFFGMPLPSTVVIVGRGGRERFLELDPYCYMEIFSRQALGLCLPVSPEVLARLCPVTNASIYALYLSQVEREELTQKGYDVEVIDTIHADDDYLSITARLARRWKNKIEGRIIGDPVLVSHLIPLACRKNFLSVYSKPQSRIMEELGEEISNEGKVVLGRQYEDSDFFVLSRMDRCFQVVDPCRPLFTVREYGDYSWRTSTQGFYAHEPTDEELRVYASENRILISLLFWTGMIRELENLYRIMDLVALTRMKGGIVLTAQSFEQMMHPPLELIAIPLEQGGVYPFLEPLLGSCGLGVGIESLMSPETLGQSLREAQERIGKLTGGDSFLPKGWWPTMDAYLLKAPWYQRSIPIKLERRAPYLKIRCRAKEGRAKVSGRKDLLREKLEEKFKFLGLEGLFQKYRPYELFQAGEMGKGIIEAVKSAGLEYMFSKSDFGLPKVLYLDKEFIALNYTVGRWDGWTPFLTINSLSDLQRVERKLLRRKKPGWIVGTVDACLWTFSGPIWERGKELKQIASFVSGGGIKERLVNVTPHSVSRYARIIAEDFQGNDSDFSGGTEW